MYTVQYLISPRTDSAHEPSPSIAVPVLVFYYLLVLLWFTCYARLFITVVINPGYVEQRHGALGSDAPTIKEKKATPLFACAPSTTKEAYPMLDRVAIITGTVAAPPGLDQFYSKDVFICDPDGLPKWCGFCHNWKPDRAHHCSEVGRCVARFDHFCPWVGGVVSETSQKFFLQFLIYAAVWACLAAGFVTWAVVDRAKRTTGSKVDANWIAACVLLWVLGIFIAGGMCCTSFKYAFFNETTNEAMFKRAHILAVRLYDGMDPTVKGLATITYPFGATVSRYYYQCFRPSLTSGVGRRSENLCNCTYACRPQSLGHWRRTKLAERSGRASGRLDTSIPIPTNMQSWQRGQPISARTGLSACITRRRLERYKLPGIKEFIAIRLTSSVSQVVIYVLCLQPTLSTKT